VLVLVLRFCAYTMEVYILNVSLNCESVKDEGSTKYKL